MVSMFESANYFPNSNFCKPMFFCFFSSTFYFTFFIYPQGTFWGLIAGFLAGIIRMILDFSYPAPSCNEVDTRPSIVKNVHFFYVALILFVLTGVVCVVVSLLTKPPGDELVNMSFLKLFSL